jgi:hypothetical protein
MCFYFRYTFPLKVERGSQNMLHSSVLWRFFCLLARNTKHFSELLPTMRKNVPYCCLQCQSFFCVVDNNAENCSNFNSCVFFRIVAHNTNNFSALRPPAPKKKNLSALLPTLQKMVGIVGNNAEKWLYFNISINSQPHANLH